MPRVIESTEPVGKLITWPSDNYPDGYLYCDGASVLVADFPALFAEIGYTHGGAGANFNIPDGRGFFPRGVSDGTGRDPDAGSRTAMNPGGNTGNAVGSVQGHTFGSHAHGGGSHGHGFTQPTISSIIGGPFGSPGGNPILSGADSSLAYGLSAFSGSVHGVGPIIATEGGNENRPLNFGVKFIIRY